MCRERTHHAGLDDVFTLPCLGFPLPRMLRAAACCVYRAQDMLKVSQFALYGRGLSARSLWSRCWWLEQSALPP